MSVAQRNYIHSTVVGYLLPWPSPKTDPNPKPQPLALTLTMNSNLTRLVHVGDLGYGGILLVLETACQLLTGMARNNL